MAPSVTPNRTGVRIHGRCHIHARCRVHRISINHHWRRRYNDRPANHDGLGNEGSPFLDNDRRRSPVLVRLNSPLIAWQELVHLLHPRSLYACTLFPCSSPCAQQTQEPIVRSMEWVFSRRIVTSNAHK
jgi:hypothetical protein